MGFRGVLGLARGFGKVVVGLGGLGFRSFGLGRIGFRDLGLRENLATGFKVLCSGMWF